MEKLADLFLLGPSPTVAENVTCVVYFSSWARNTFLIYQLAGKYIYIETSAPRVQGDKAKLVTSMFPAGNRCLQFYYHMKGANIGKLTVYVQEQGGSAYPEWTKTGEAGDDWNLGLIQINTKRSYQVSHQTAKC